MFKRKDKNKDKEDEFEVLTGWTVDDQTAKKGIVRT